MRTRSMCIGLAWVFAAVILLSLPCLAEDAAIEKIGGYGYIDWVGQKVIAKGTGAPPKKYFGKPQARPMAMRAATADARRNLLEVVKGVHVDAKTTIENRLTKDDTIITRVKGLLKASTVDDIQYLSDGTIEATVSMPLTGELGEFLLRETVAAPGASGKSAGVAAVSNPGLQNRIQQLENRVEALEEKLGMMGKVAYEQGETIDLFKRLAVAWMEMSASDRMIVQAAYKGGGEISAIEGRLKSQEERLVSLSKQLEKIAMRLDSIEKAAPSVVEKSAAARVAYTGLVIDARESGFQPCLKPNLFSGGKVVYPGEYVNRTRAFSRGYVRFYRQVTRAQQSDRAGSLPLTIKAVGTYDGKRNLELDAKDGALLESFLDAPESFLKSCNVVIVF